MIGVFDSGRGGVNTARELLALSGGEDIILFCDRKNAPFGTKSEEEITEITERGIRRLIGMGARRVLIGCCTASSVYKNLSDYAKSLSLPIIEASVSRALKNGRRVTVLATDASVHSRCFSEEIKRQSGETLAELSGQYLVGAVERGEKNRNISKKTEEYIDALAEKIAEQEPDALILGCTHFPALDEEFERRLGKTAVISSAKAGAEELAKIIGFTKENKKITYIST